MATMEEKLLMGVLTQIDVGRIDYDELANYIGVATSKAARCRWDRYKQKLTKGAPPLTPKKAAGVGKKIGSVSPKKAGGSPKKNNRGIPKKSRGRIKEESDEEVKEVDMNEDEGMNYDKNNSDLDVEMEDPVTPSRRLPSRRGRVTKFVEETSDVEDEQEEEDGEVQVDAEVEGMKELAVKDEDDERYQDEDEA
ncbi:uncharacterized protein EAF01_004689 [Botrytis porri]|uniref:Myb-like DNA-binding domain-containing protein n=1 Tax=Botrytis porri TaxID=87229 RepID=A0A4Z1KMW7_9HELO|nr:uncharacterized protein EAF01_004689 [Botrytis porri]KAF7907102.1 hypothetical protein EAF01_004689 [Botrytis porri]TGO82729.1 hypothetical protein BPOR_0770g00080 [Botrytis porri]